MYRLEQAIVEHADEFRAVHCDPLALFDEYNVAWRCAIESDYCTAYRAFCQLAMRVHYADVLTKAARGRIGDKRLRALRQLFRGKKKGLMVDAGSRLAYWEGERLDISSHVDFTVLQSLHAAKGGIVSYVGLLRAIKPDEITKEVKKVKEAPPEVKQAVSHIRRALKKAHCPLTVKSVRGEGYRLCRPDE